MAYDVLIQRRLEEVEETLITYNDPIERMYIWFTFIRSFAEEAHTLFDKQYEEFVKLCAKYTETPDPTARKEMRKEIKHCVNEINKINALLKKIPRIQSRLEKAILK